MKITDTKIETELKVPPSGNHIEWDDKIPGFGVRITSNGVIAFVLSYRIKNRKRRYTIARYEKQAVNDDHYMNAEDARSKALELQKAIRNGIDPMDPEPEPVQAKPGETTFAELARLYLEHAEKHKRPGSLRNDRGNINRLLLPQWADCKIADIKLRHIEKLHRSRSDTPYHANRVLALISNMFTKAVEWDLCDKSPIKKGVVKRLRFDEDPNQNPLNEEEQKLLHRALDQYKDQNAADAIRLLLFTGSREGEVLKADWDQFVLTAGKKPSWTKPSHNTKQRKLETIPLNPKALDVLRRLGPKKKGPLFPGAARGSYRVTLRKPWVQICKAAGLSEAVERPGKRRKSVIRYKPTVRLHDLRHTFATDLVNRGVSIYLVSKLIGHTNVATTQRYANPVTEALQEATNQFGVTQ
jgi:integrase